MPFYDYTCKDCKETQTYRIPLSDIELPLACPACEGTLRRHFSVPVVKVVPGASDVLHDAANGRRVVPGMSYGESVAAANSLAKEQKKGRSSRGTLEQRNTHKKSAPIKIYT